MIIYHGGPQQSLAELVLFPFDDHSIPFQNGVELKLVGHNTPCGRTKIVLGLGEEGAPDDSHVVYYGAVHQVGDELYMWYLGQNRQEGSWFERVCFAKSKTGTHLGPNREATVCALQAGSVIDLAISSLSWGDAWPRGMSRTLSRRRSTWKAKPHAWL